uniref:Uncharacterized protein n=1 Tax=Cacopsylla melanoneura TaxID=428564 RepID=A0A8D8SCW8_9HEMI
MSQFYKETVFLTRSFLTRLTLSFASVIPLSSISSSSIFCCLLSKTLTEFSLLLNSCCVFPWEINSFKIPLRCDFSFESSRLVSIPPFHSKSTLFSSLFSFSDIGSTRGVMTSFCIVFIVVGKDVCRNVGSVPVFGLGLVDDMPVLWFSFPGEVCFGLAVEVRCVIVVFPMGLVMVIS